MMSEKLEKYEWSIKLSGGIIAKNRQHALDIAKHQVLLYMPMVPKSLMDML